MNRFDTKILRKEVEQDIVDTMACEKFPYDPITGLVTAHKEPACNCVEIFDAFGNSVSDWCFSFTYPSDENVSIETLQRRVANYLHVWGWKVEPSKVRIID